MTSLIELVDKDAKKSYHSYITCVPETRQKTEHERWVDVEDILNAANQKSEFSLYFIELSRC
jgi:hypothetical protein